MPELFVTECASLPWLILTTFFKYLLHWIVLSHLFFLLLIHTGDYRSFLVMCIFFTYPFVHSSLQFDFCKTSRRKSLVRCSFHKLVSLRFTYKHRIIKLYPINILDIEPLPHHLNRPPILHILRRATFFKQDIVVDTLCSSRMFPLLRFYMLYKQTAIITILRFEFLILRPIIISNH